MALGAVGEGLRRATGTSNGDEGSLMLSEKNMERLVAKLSRMRGAALKLGQMMSFQGLYQMPYLSLTSHSHFLRFKDASSSNSRGPPTCPRSC
jgi:hypothetical protein